MSWFDAAKFSSYAKTALKQAQKNIDKVLDIKDEDEDTNKSSNIANTSQITSNANYLTTSQSTPCVSKESDSFFDSFLGSELKNQLSYYTSTSETADVPSTDANTNVEATSPRKKGKLRDRKSVQKDKTKLSATVNQGVERSNSPTSTECQFVGLDTTSKPNDAEIILNHSNASSTGEDQLFDDIDLSDTDTNFSYSNISDVSEDLSSPGQISSSLSNFSKTEGIVLGGASSTEKTVSSDIVLSDADSTENTISSSMIPGFDVEFEKTDKETVHDDINTQITSGNVTDNVNSNFQQSSTNKTILATTSTLQVQTSDVISDDDTEGSVVNITKPENLLIDTSHYSYSDPNQSDDESLSLDPIPEEDTSSNDGHKDIEKLSDESLNLNSIPDEDTSSNDGHKDLENESSNVSYFEIVHSADMTTSKNDLTDTCIKMVCELPEGSDKDDNLLVNLNEEILSEQSCELRSSDSGTEFQEDILDVNEIPRCVSAEHKENEGKNEIELLCTGVNKEVEENVTQEESEQHSLEVNIKDTHNEVGDTCKSIESEDSLVHIDSISRSDGDSSSLCVVEPSQYDPLESIMKQAESILITSTNDTDNIGNLQQEMNAFETISEIKKNNVGVLEVSMGGGEDKSDLQFNTTEKNDTSQVNELNEKIGGLTKEIKELRSIIDARESKIMELYQQNMSFQESISVYQNQINQLEQVNKGDDEEMENMRQEFTKRIADCDSKCQAAIKERDYCKAKLIETEACIRQSANEQVSVLTNALLEKEETIKDLLNEGEALSKKELERNTHIKKLRVKLKEVTTKNTNLTEQVTGFESEIQKLKEVIIERESNEKKLEGELKKLEEITDSQEDEVSTLKETLDDMEEKYTAMESTLKNAYSEINRLNLENAQKDSEMQEASDAFAQRKVLEERLKDLEKTSKIGKEDLLMQLEDLQLAYSRLEHQLGRREDELKKEIEDLHNRLEHAMYRNQELSQSVSAATKPLLRQIENLQSTYSVQSEGWECVEKSLNDRLISLQDQLALAVEKERAASELAMEASSKLKAIKTQEGVLRSEKTNLQISLDDQSNRCKEIESEWKREQSSYETKLSKLKMVVSELQGEKRVLEEQLTVERVKYENDTLRMSTQLTLQQQKSQEAQASTPSSRHSSRTSSISGDLDISPQKTLQSDTPLERYLSHSTSSHEGGFQKGAVTTTAASIEHLKSQLRSREGEVFVLHEQIKELKKTKASLAHELVNLANKVEELECSNEDFEKLKEEHSELKSRYNAVLQMYGEKAEEAEELKMDIEDVKNMYRQQIQQLCGGAR